MELINFLLRHSRSVRYSRAIIAVVFVTGLIGGASNTLLLTLVNRVLHAATGSAAHLLWAFAALCLLNLGCKFVSQSLLIRFSTAAMSNLRMRLCRRILFAPLRQLEVVGQHRLLATVTEDIPIINNAMANIPLICINVSIVAGCLVYLCWLSWKLFLVSAFLIAVGIAGYRLLLRRAQGHFRTLREEWDTLLKHLRGLTEGTKELKIHRRRRADFLTQYLQPSNAALANYRVAANILYVLANSWAQALIFVILCLLLFGSPYFGADGAPVLTGYTLTILYMTAPLQLTLSLLPAFGQANVAVRKVEELGLSLGNREAADDAAPAPGPNGLASWDRLELVDVTHTYRHERDGSLFTLGPINLTIRPGELIMVTGGNGSGKTTLIKLLVGLYSPETGQIRLNGRTVTEELREYYYQHFSVVFYDFYLFEKFLGLDSVNLDAKTREYLSLLHLENKVKVADGVLSTTELSQGQRKRLALLTSYLEDRPIYVFDEWAADQDPVFKEIFYLHLLPELKARGKTIISISHDDRYFYVADRLIKLEDGQLCSDQPSASPSSPSLRFIIPAVV